MTTYTAIITEKFNQKCFDIWADTAKDAATKARTMIPDHFGDDVEIWIEDAPDHIVYHERITTNI